MIELRQANNVADKREQTVRIFPNLRSYMHSFVRINHFILYQFSIATDSCNGRF